MYCTLPDYVCMTKQNIDRYGGNGDSVFNSTLSNAMVMCYNMAIQYATQRKLKNLPVPISIVAKSDPDSGETYTQIRFTNEVNINTFEKVAAMMTSPNATIQINPSASSVCVDIYTQINKAY